MNPLKEVKMMLKDVEITSYSLFMDLHYNLSDLNITDQYGHAEAEILKNFEQLCQQKISGSLLPNQIVEAFKTGLNKARSANEMSQSKASDSDAHVLLPHEVQRLVVEAQSFLNSALVSSIRYGFAEPSDSEKLAA